MPEPLPAGASTPTDRTASTPATQDKPTTTNISDPLMDQLQIPKDLQAQIISTETREEPELKPDAAVVAASTPEPPTPETPPARETPQTQDEPGSPIPATAKKDNPDEDDDEDDDEFPAIPKGDEQQPQKPDKRQKRIDRLTRQRSRLENEIAQLRDQLSKAEEQRQPAEGPEIPSAVPKLAYITDERQLAQEIARSNAVIDWCTHNTGVTLEEKQLPDAIKADYAEGKLTLQEASARTIAQWKDECQSLLLNAPTRREEIRAYGGEQQHFDSLARQESPAIFDKKSEDYQAAATIRKLFPWINNSPRQNYAIGLVIEGIRARNARLKANGNGNGNGHRQTRDIDPRVFEPRVPLAPDTPEPPSREAGAAPSQKELNDAMTALVKDPDGSAASLAAVLAAEEKMARRSGSSAGSRQPVAV